MPTGPDLLSTTVALVVALLTALSVGLAVGGALGIAWMRRRRTRAAARPAPERARAADRDGDGAERPAESSVAAAPAAATLLASLNQELRTPLTGLLGMLELLRRVELPSEERRFLELADGAGRKLQGVLDDLVELAQVETGALEPGEDVVALEPLLRQIQQELAQRSMGNGGRLTCRLDADAPTVVRSDRRRLKRLLHLLAEAAIARLRGSFELRLYGETEATRRGLRVVLRQAARETAAGQGTAMRDAALLAAASGEALPPFGLLAGQRLARAMGGSLATGEGEESGVLLVLRLPLAERTSPPASAPERPGLPLPAPSGEQRPAGGRAEADPAALGTPLAGLRILVGEDSALTRLLLGEMLRKLGAVPYLVHDGRMAVDAVRVGDFDVALLDLRMPVLDGLAAARAIRALGPPYDRLPLLGLTADVLPRGTARYREAGIETVLSKPVDWPDLVAAVLASLPPRDPQGTPRGGTARRTRELIREACDSQPTLDPAVQTALAGAIGEARTRQIVELWPGFAGEFLGHVESARKTGDAEALARAAHSIKGTAGYLGFARLEALCLLAQRTASERSLLEEFAPEIAQEIRRTLDSAGQAATPLQPAERSERGSPEPD